MEKRLPERLIIVGLEQPQLPAAGYLRYVDQFYRIG